MERTNHILPRLIRHRDAPAYLGMDRNKFNAWVRPDLTEVPLRKQAIAYDRLELDAWADDYIRRNGRPGLPIGDQLWDAKHHRASRSARASGTSTNTSADGVFAKAELAEAERFLARLTEEFRQAKVYGVRPSRTFEQAGAKFVLENQHKRSIRHDIGRLKLLMPWIGQETLERLHRGSLEPWIEHRRRKALRSAPSIMV